MKTQVLLSSTVWLVYMAGQVFSLPWSLMDQEEDNLDRAARRTHEVEGARCGYFEEHVRKSLFGFNTKRIEDLTLDECLQKCTKERSFYCRSVDFNADSATSGDKTTCFLSSENSESQPDALDVNFNTNYYERSCAPPQSEEGSGGQYAY